MPSIKVRAARTSLLQRIFWAATVAAPGTIEGMVYLRPFIMPEFHLRVKPEIILQGLVVVLFIAGAMMERPKRVSAQGVS